MMIDLIKFPVLSLNGGQTVYFPSILRVSVVQNKFPRMMESKFSHLNEDDTFSDALMEKA